MIELKVQCQNVKKFFLKKNLSLSYKVTFDYFTLT